MSILSDSIEEFINRLFEDEDNGVIEFKRNQLAEEFDCAPSQINYVLQTRFSTNRGYIIESKRGGGGYIKVTKLEIDEDYREIILDSIGDSITKYKSDRLIEGLYDEGVIEINEMNLVKVILSDRSLERVPHEERNYIRADIIKNILNVIENRGD
ncbi:MAG: CtsR family transcriptional regulator [Tissierellia bacterium]|nr:CtsR family transcriptional regulator [Tissierellia bacterium]